MITWIDEAINADKHFIIFANHHNVTGFWKMEQIVTLALYHFIGQANSYT